MNVSYIKLHILHQTANILFKNISIIINIRFFICFSQRHIGADPVAKKSPAPAALGMTRDTEQGSDKPHFVHSSKVAANFVGGCPLRDVALYPCIRNRVAPLLSIRARQRSRICEGCFPSTPPLKRYPNLQTCDPVTSIVLFCDDELRLVAVQALARVNG